MTDRKAFIWKRQSPGTSGKHRAKRNSNRIVCPLLWQGEALGASVPARGIPATVFTTKMSLLVLVGSARLCPLHPSSSRKTPREHTIKSICSAVPAQERTKHSLASGRLRSVAAAAI